MSGAEVKKLKYDLIGGGCLPLSCKVSGGKIVPALSAGVIDSRCPAGVRFAAFAGHTDRIFVVAKDGCYCAAERNPYVSLTTSAAATMPFLVEYRSGASDISALCIDDRIVLQMGNTRSVGVFSAGVGGGVYKNGRLFAVDLSDKRKLRWSGEDGPEDWTEKIDGAGWLYTDKELGEIYNLFALDGQIAAVKKFGVSLISAFGTPENFKETKSVITPKPFKNAAAVCGDKLYFYTADGLYSFTSSGAEKVDMDLAEEFSSPEYAVSYGEELFVVGFHNGLGKKVILVYDTVKKSTYFIDLPATAMCVGSCVYAFTEEGAVTLSEGGKFTYSSGNFAYFSKRKKALKSVVTDCEKEVDITVQTDSGSRTFKGVKGKLSPHMCGRFFKVTISGDCEIKEL